jgi:hypothetical protein
MNVLPILMAVLKSALTRLDHISVAATNSGYSLSSDDRACLDINECNQVAHNCQQGCVNTRGGFRCTCNLGYQPTSDQMTCTGWLKFTWVY